MSKKHPLTIAEQLENKSQAIKESFFTKRDEELRDAKEHVEELRSKKNTAENSHQSSVFLRKY